MCRENLAPNVYFFDVFVVKKKDVEIREKALNLSLQKHNATK